MLLVSLDYNSMEGIMEDGYIANVNSSDTLNYTTYTELRTLQIFVMKKAHTTNFCSLKKRTLQTSILEKCGHYKLL